jgi:hypothetical protein
MVDSSGGLTYKSLGSLIVDILFPLDEGGDSVGLCGIYSMDEDIDIGGLSSGVYGYGGVIDGVPGSYIGLSIGEPGAYGGLSSGERGNIVDPVYHRGISSSSIGGIISPSSKDPS